MGTLIVERGGQEIPRDFANETAAREWLEGTFTEIPLHRWEPRAETPPAPDTRPAEEPKPESAPGENTESAPQEEDRGPPPFLAERRIWHAWAPTGDGRKPPVGDDGRPLAKWNDPANALTYEQARERARKLNGKGGGVGFITADGVAAIDLDYVPEGDPIHDSLRETGAYVERSPSGNGWHVVGRGADTLELSWKGGREKPVASKLAGFVTYTGRDASGDPTIDISNPITFLRCEFDPKAAPAPTREPEKPKPLAAPLMPGTRNTDLAAIAGSLRRIGADGDLLAEMLGAVNRRRGNPPVEDSEVECIARSIGRGEGGELPEYEPLTFLRAVDVIGERSRPEVVRGIAGPGMTSVLVAEPGMGKTFVLLALAAAVAQGKPFNGRRAKQGAVAYITFEGDAMNKRLAALAEQGEDISAVHVLRASDPISPRVGRDGIEEPSIGEARILEALRRLATGTDVALVVCDTVRASLAGSEDSSENVSAYLRAVKRIAAEAPDAAVFLAHHTGWQDGENKRKRERGSSSFRGNVEYTFFLGGVGDTKTDGAAFLEWSPLKVKDGELGAGLGFELRRVVLESIPPDEDGKPTSCVAVPADLTEVRKRRAAERASDAAGLVIDILRAAPGLTSQRALATKLGKRREALGEALREMMAGDEPLLSGGGGKPYELTAEGAARLDAAGDAAGGL